MKILSEDTSLKVRLESMLKSKGVILTSKSVGGVVNLVKILGLDMDDLKTQEMLVKNFIYNTNIPDVDISFLEINKNRPDKVRIKIYFRTNLIASNMESWVISTFRDEMNKFFPFKSTAVYEPAFAGRNTTVVLDSEQIEESEEDDDDFIVENNNKLKDKVSQLIDSKGILIAGKSVGGFKNLVNIVGKDEIIWMLKPPFFHNLYNIGASNRDQSNMIQDLLRFYLSNNVEIGEISGLNDGGDIYVENKNGDYIYFETYDGKEWDINDFDDNDNNIYYEDQDGYWFKQKFDEYGNTIYKLDSYGNETTENVNEGLENTWNTGNEHGNKYDYQHGFCHYFAYNIIGKLKKLYPEKNIRYYLILADEVYDFDEGDVEQSYLVHAYIKIDELYLDSEGFSTEDEIEERMEDWYQRQLIELPEDYRLDMWHDEYDQIPKYFFNNQFCNTGTIKKDIEKFLSHSEVKELLKSNINESSDKSKEEPTNSGKENLLKLKEKIGFDKALKAVGGLENFIRIVYGGDIKQFFKDENIEPYRISSEPNLYISDIIVQSLELKDAPFSSGKEKDLGDFSWVSGGIRYKFNGYLRRVNFTSGKVEWRVVGQSGDSGFGYSFITKKNTLGKRARMQIFQQIIDKYNLQKYI